MSEATNRYVAGNGETYQGDHGKGGRRTGALAEIWPLGIVTESSDLLVARDALTVSGPSANWVQASEDSWWPEATRVECRAARRQVLAWWVWFRGVLGC